MAAEILYYLTYYTGIAVLNLSAFYCICWLYIRVVDKVATSTSTTLVLFEYAIYRKEFRKWLEEQESEL